MKPPPYPTDATAQPRYTAVPSAPTNNKNGGRQAFTAYSAQPERPPPFKSRFWKVWLVMADCFFIGLAPVLVHMAKNKEGRFSFHPVSINLLVEVSKTIFATIVLIIHGTGRPGVPMYRSAKAFVKDASHNRLLAIPAGLYAINNYLKFAMQIYFKPTTAKMLGNLKILVIAMLMKVVLKRSFSIFQWEALVLLVAGITVNQLNYCKPTDANAVALAAVLYTLGSVTVPSLASVYNEFALKKHMDTSVHLQNFYLYFFGAAFNFMGLLLVMAIGGESFANMFKGHTTITMLLIINNGLQGILSSFFFKYADTILKKYSSTMATINTGILSAVLFGHKITANFCIGVTIVFISMHQFFSQVSSSVNLNTVFETYGLTGFRYMIGGVKGVAKGKDHDQNTRPSFAVSPSMEHLNIKTAESTDSLAALDATLGDPDTPHLHNPRRTISMSLPR